MAKRAERFGQNSSENAKKLARAQRYVSERESLCVVVFPYIPLFPSLPILGRFGSSLENGSLGKGARAPPTVSQGIHQVPY